MQKILLTALFFSALALTACGSKDEDSENTNYKYSYEYNGCKTEEHTFDGKDAYCAGLKNDELNHYCAYDMRKEAYEKACGSDFASRN